MSRSIGVRLAVIVSLVLVVVATAMASYFARLRVQEIRSEQRARAVSMLGALAVPCASALASGERRRLDSYIAETVSLGGRLSVLGIALYDHKGTRVVSHVADTAPTTPNNDADFVSTGLDSADVLWSRRSGTTGETLSVSMPVVSGMRFGTLVGRFDSSAEQHAVSNVYRVAILVTVLTVVLAAGILWFVVSLTVIRPVTQVVNAAEMVAGGNFDVRLKFGRADKVGRLAQAFDRMAEQLQDYTQGLERKVEAESAEVARQSQELKKVNSRLQSAVAELERLAVTDPLTGLCNRRHFDMTLDVELKRSARSGSPLSLVLLDVDHFKHYNDTLGHPAGDEALRTLARVLTETLRETDSVARWGGEEFAVLLVGTGPAAALEVAEKLRTAVRAADVMGAADQPGGAFTISLGVATSPDHAADAEKLLKLVDTAMYTAKRAGRDRAHLTTGAITIDEIELPEVNV